MPVYSYSLDISSDKDALQKLHKPGLEDRIWDERDVQDEDSKLRIQNSNLRTQNFLND
jgi:hypothetical protein